MIQFLADQIDQLDLAMDQLALRDRNFDRFAMMLVDNVAELTLHQYALDQQQANEYWSSFQKPKHDVKAVSAATGQRFDEKVKLAKITNFISPEMSDSIQYLHAFRNVVYHQGIKHETILHSLCLFYIENVCSILTSYQSSMWFSHSRDQISYRARKYLGKDPSLENKIVFKNAFERISEVAICIGDALISDLHADMKLTITSANDHMDFLVRDSPKLLTRDETIIQCQAWPFAFSKEGKEWADKNGGPQDGTVGGYLDWIRQKYPWPVRSDPVPSWLNRLKSLASENDKHAALKKYCDFMRQTESIRENLEVAASQLDAKIQMDIDEARGK